MTKRECTMSGVHRRAVPFSESGKVFPMWFTLICMCMCVCTHVAVCMCAMPQRCITIVLLLLNKASYANEQCANQRYFRHICIGILYRWWYLDYCSKLHTGLPACRLSCLDHVLQSVGKGPSIYDVHKKIGFCPLCPHVSTWAGPPSPPCGRPHAVDMKYTPLSWNG